MIIVFLGPPGAGKGTQAKLISDKYGLLHMSTGDMLRAEIRTGTELGLIAKEIINRGELVPDELIVKMVEDRMKQPDAKDGMILDGFPRTLSQADLLDNFVDIDAVVDIDVPDAVIVDRISSRRNCRQCGASCSVYENPTDQCRVCGGEMYIRDDDNEVAVKTRLNVYNERTLPIIKYYEQKGLLITVDGSGAVDDIFQRIVAGLDGARK